VEASEKLLGQIAACLRLTRPMRQTASYLRSRVKEDGTFYIDSFQSSANMLDVPELNKLSEFGRLPAEHAFAEHAFVDSRMLRP
jgi:hypothetical protein